MFYPQAPQAHRPLSRDEIVNAGLSVDFFRSLPKSLHTRELALAMIAQRVTLDELDPSVWSIDILRAFARKCGQTTMTALFRTTTSVELTPKQRRQLCHIAVHQSPFAFREIPETYRHDVELCRLATRTGHNLHLVPVDLRTLEMCELALTKRPFIIADFPLGILSAKHCQTAVKMDTSAFPSVPASFRTPELTRFAIQHAKSKDRHDDVLFYIVRHIVEVDDTLLYELVHEFGCRVLTSIAQELISDDTWVELVNVALVSTHIYNEEAIQEILPHKRHFTEERYYVFCRMAVKSRPNAMHFMTNLDLIWKLCTEQVLCQEPCQEPCQEQGQEQGQEPCQEQGQEPCQEQGQEQGQDSTSSIITFSYDSSSLSPMFWDLYTHFKGATDTVADTAVAETVADTVADTVEAETEDNTVGFEEEEQKKIRAMLCATMEFRTDPIVHKLCARLGPHAFSVPDGCRAFYRIHRISNMLLPFAKIRVEWNDYASDTVENVEVDTIAALLSLIREFESKTTGLQERRIKLESAIQLWR